MNKVPDQRLQLQLDPETRYQPIEGFGASGCWWAQTTLHDDLTLGQVSSWQYWIAVSKHDFRDGLIYVDEVTQTHTQTERLWALGNYSRFIAPQSRRVALKGSGSLKASAYLSPNAQSLTAVVTNLADEAVAATFGMPSDFRVAQRFETSNDHNLVLVEEGLPDDQAMISPPRSVSTVVFQSHRARA